MRDRAKGGDNGRRVQIRPVGGDPHYPQPTGLERHLKTAEKGGDNVLIGGLVALQHLIEHAFESVVVNDPHSPCSWGNVDSTQNGPSYTSSAAM